MLKKRIFIAASVLALLLIALLYIATKQARVLHRDPLVLMNKFYQLKTPNPRAAERSLLILLNQDANYLPALEEYSQWMLADNNQEQALSLLIRLNQNLPNNNIYAFQLGYLYYVNGEWEQSRKVFLQLLQHVTGPLRVKTLAVLKAMDSYLPHYQNNAATQQLMITSSMVPEASNALSRQHRMSSSVIKYSEMSQTKSIMDSYYAFKLIDKPASEHEIKQVLIRQPNNVLALKEAGYLAITEGHLGEAIYYFRRAYALTYQPELAMQLAYLYERLNDKPAAFQYFRAAARSEDKQLSSDAQNAMTNIAGQQIKVLPAPFFSEIYFNPFTQSRFGLTVLPFIGRLGIEQANRLHTKEYLFLRRTQDNQSRNLGELSQIYEDDVQITGVGFQFTPSRRVPVVGFVEVGEAYDLVYRNRNRWRGDLRGGFMYYQDFGTRPAYFENIKISHHYYSDWYADITYFSRYDNNVIGTVRTHQGIRLLQYQSSMLNLYVTGRVIEDTQRQFFNNIAEIGPGVSFVPSNRFNVQLRFERVNGVYLPAGASVNPYSKYYTNNLVQLLIYIKL